MIRRALALVCALFALALPLRASAHGRSTSYISVQQDGAEAVLRVRMAAIDETALAASWASGASRPAASAASALPAAVVLRGDSGPCAPLPSSFRELAAEAGSMGFEWRVRCSEPGGALFLPTVARTDLFFDIVPAHVALLRVEPAPGSPDAAEYVLTEARREAPLPAASNAPSGSAPQSASATALRFLRAGVEHLLTGWDHIAFLCALLLASRSLRAATLALTGFTLGHSVTLSLSVIGYAAPRSSTVEALIAASIALVAIENVWIADGREHRRLPAVAVVFLALLAPAAALLGTAAPSAILGVAIFEGFYFAILARARRPEDLRGVAAALFGLLHGFGFAGVLRQMDIGSGIPLVPLASFNIGIEIAQIALACAAWPLLSHLRRRFGQDSVISRGSAIPLAFGVYWLVARIFG